MAKNKYLMRLSAYCSYKLNVTFTVTLVRYTEHPLVVGRPARQAQHPPVIVKSRCDKFSKRTGYASNINYNEH